MKPVSKTFSMVDAIKSSIQWSVVRRALIMSAVVGTILVGINHGMCLYLGHFNSVCMVQSAMTFVVPYMVSTISSVLAMSELNRSQSF